MTAPVQPANTSRRRIQQRRHRDVVVLRPLDVLDHDLAGDIREQVLEAHAPVVIDLDHCMHFEASAIRDIASAWQLYRPHLSFACSSPGDRRMMEAMDAAADVTVFASVEEALAALSSASG